MKKYLLIILILSCGIKAFPQKFFFNYNRDFDQILDRSKMAADPVYFNTLLKRFKADDSTLTSYEVLCLEIGFTAQPTYLPYEIIPLEDRIYTLNEASKYKDAVALGDSLLAVYPLSQKAFAEMAYAYYQLGDDKKMEYYSDLFMKMMDCIFNGADGTDPETAYFILGPDDGQNFIKKYIRGKVGNTASGKDKSGHDLVILEYLPKSDSKAKPSTLYFNIQHAVNSKNK